MSEELYKKYRPTQFNQVIGQREAMSAINDMGKRHAIPHVLLFTGPSGCGKTTVARILRHKLKCGDFDFIEMNAAESRGIDDIRDIKAHMGAAPMGGTCRIWLVDEVHQLTSAAQDAFLKLLEDTPNHVYFFLCTTDPQKLKKTIQTRCTEVKFKLLAETDLHKLVVDVAAKEGKPLEEEVARKIAVVADGSARKALVILHAVIGLPTASDKLAGIASGDSKGQTIELCRLLLNANAQWGQVASILEKAEDDAEAMRRMILGYAKSVLLKSGSQRAHLIIEVMRDHLYDVGMPGLVSNCFAIMKGD